MDGWDRVRVYARQAGKDLFTHNTLTPKQEKRYQKKYWRDQKQYEKTLDSWRARVAKGATAEELGLEKWELDLIMRRDEVD
jgi:hypothetical protein